MTFAAPMARVGATRRVSLSQKTHHRGSVTFRPKQVARFSLRKDVTPRAAGVNVGNGIVVHVEPMVGGGAGGDISHVRRTKPGLI